MAAHYGASTQLLAASATIGNPIEFVTGLTGLEEFTLVDYDGSERRRRTILVCNPPPRSEDHAEEADDEDSTEGVPDEDLGRVAPQTIAIELAGSASLASPNHPPVRVIGFCRSRNGAYLGDTASPERWTGDDLEDGQRLRDIADQLLALSQRAGID